jgi:parvulin-like peptidyl-prolyl isomerase
MMHKMRENTKVIMWVVVVAFIVTIFAVWGLDLQTGKSSSDPNVVGLVNGVPISRSQYQFVYEQFAQQMRSSSPDQSLTYSQQEFVSNQAWDNIVYGILTDQEIRRLGITVTDDEVVSYLRNTPPPEVRQYFLDENGLFDNSAYQAALSNPEVDWTQLEGLARERIPRAKLNEILSAQVHVSENEVRHSYESESLNLKISYVEFPFGDTDIGDYAPSEDEINAHYEENKSDFQLAERARVELVQIPLAPSSSDVADAAFTATSLYEQLADGEDFAFMAKTYSQAPTSFVEGNTGFISKGQRDDAYFEALATMSPDELSEPVATSEGHYILKLIESREGETGETEYNVQEILITAIITRQTSDSLYAHLAKVIEQATELGFIEAAAEAGLTVQTPEPFLKDGPIGIIGFVPSLSRFAFANEPGATSDVLRDENNLYMARVAERIPESYQALEEIRDVLVSRLLNEKRKAVAEVNARAFRQKARNDGFETAAQTYNATVANPDTFRVVDNLELFGARSTVAEAALNVAQGEISPPIESRQSYVVLEVHYRSEIDPEDYREQIPPIRDRLLNQKVQQYITFWYERLRDDSEVEDYRI